jgi:hypothetical protein
MFPLNFMDLYEIDLTPQGASRTWARLGEGLTSGVIANNDVIDQTSYLNGNGYGSSDVTGGQVTIAFSGHRVVGDTAQDYITSIRNEFGAGRKTNFRYRDAKGEGISGACTIANIEIGGGDANTKKDISFEIHLNGKPTEVPLANVDELSITVAEGTVAGTTKVTASAGEGNSLGYKLSAIDSPQLYANQFMGDYIGYTSESNITAIEGQYLTVYEIDANERLIKANSHLLVAGDLA